MVQRIRNRLRINWGALSVLLMVWMWFFPTPSDVLTTFQPTVQRKIADIAAFLAEPPRIALAPNQVVVPTFPFGQMIVAAPAGGRKAGASQTNSIVPSEPPWFAPFHKARVAEVLRSEATPWYSSGTPPAMRESETVL